MSSILKQPLKVALLQLKVTADKALNIANAEKRILEAAGNGAKLIILPECWNSPYAVTAFPQYAEAIPNGETTSFLSNIASKSNTFIIGGSFPENDGGKVYNTSLTFNPSGKLIAKHRKVHLFDIDVPGGVRFKESDTLSPGSSETLVELEGYGSVGVGICYDIRFPELAIRAARKGAFAMIYPGAFNMTTGPAHWELLARSRAVDNQFFTVLVSPARDLSSSYHAYGHSMVSDPWGNLLCEADENETIVYAELKPEKIAETRTSIPLYTQRRFDIYPDVSK